MNEIILVRHGETDANRNYVVQGRMDNPLNEFGESQAIKTGKYFKKNQEKFDLVISSPLKRAFNTARLIIQEMDLKKPIIVHQNLIERNFGDYDGQKIDEDYSDLIKRGTIPHMEQNPELEKRVFAALKDICEQYPNKRLLIVTHSHVIKSILVHLVKEFTYTSFLSNCSINYLSYKNKMFKVNQFNINPLVE
ncbi:MAG: histidine phosphatase family protein [Firmicutes bacterium]|nr:histidine phosphatase family protein [Bacillota bacterium]